jgi:hypothetical protein
LVAGVATFPKIQAQNASSSADIEKRQDGITEPATGTKTHSITILPAAFMTKTHDKLSPMESETKI